MQRRLHRTRQHQRHAEDEEGERGEGFQCGSTMTRGTRER
jgi:hypothetical protein